MQNMNMPLYCSRYLIWWVFVSLVSIVFNFWLPSFLRWIYLHDNRIRSRPLNYFVLKSVNAPEGYTSTCMIQLQHKKPPENQSRMFPFVMCAYNSDVLLFLCRSTPFQTYLLPFLYCFYFFVDANVLETTTPHNNDDYISVLINSFCKHIEIKN